MDPGARTQAIQLVKSLRELTFQLSSTLIAPGRKAPDENEVKRLANQVETHVKQITQLLK